MVATGDGSVGIIAVGHGHAARVKSVIVTTTINETVHDRHVKAEIVRDPLPRMPGVPAFMLHRRTHRHRRPKRSCITLIKAGLLGIMQGPRKGCLRDTLSSLDDERERSGSKGRRRDARIELRLSEGSAVHEGHTISRRVPQPSSTASQASSAPYGSVLVSDSMLVEKTFPKGLSLKEQLQQYGEELRPFWLKRPPFTCQICSVKFKFNWKLHDHYVNDHANVSACRIVRALLKTDTATVEDLQILGPYSCEKCQRNFISSEKKVEHLIRQHKMNKDEAQTRARTPEDIETLPSSREEEHLPGFDVTKGPVYSGATVGEAPVYSGDQPRLPHHPAKRFCKVCWHQKPSRVPFNGTLSECENHVVNIHGKKKRKAWRYLDVVPMMKRGFWKASMIGRADKSLVQQTTAEGKQKPAQSGTKRRADDRQSATAKTNDHDQSTQSDRADDASKPARESKTEDEKSLSNFSVGPNVNASSNPVQALLQTIAGSNVRPRMDGFLSGSMVHSTVAENQPEQPKLSFTSIEDLISDGKEGQKKEKSGERGNGKPSFSGAVKHLSTGKGVIEDSQHLEKKDGAGDGWEGTSTPWASAVAGKQGSKLANEGNMFGRSQLGGASPAGGMYTPSFGNTSVHAAPALPQGSPFARLSPIAPRRDMLRNLDTPSGSTSSALSHPQHLPQASRFAALSPIAPRRDMFGNPDTSGGSTSFGALHTQHPASSTPRRGSYEVSDVSMDISDDSARVSDMESFEDQ
ncbi:hypothetical protein HDV00_007685 [Rhizophlyctis rosea]|nr:hypothetical protein HDV00_007685 [Rhizophlyctis rosea]